MTLTPGNTDDRHLFPIYSCELFGKIFAVSEAYRRYRGYVSQKLTGHLTTPPVAHHIIPVDG